MFTDDDDDDDDDAMMMGHETVKFSRTKKPRRETNSPSTNGG